MNVNTVQPDTQANVVNATLLFNTIRQHVTDVEDQALCIRSLSEIVFEQLDIIMEQTREPKILGGMQRLDALMKSIDRNAALTQDAATNISFALTEAQEVAA